MYLLLHSHEVYNLRIEILSIVEQKEKKLSRSRLRFLVFVVRWSVCRPIPGTSIRRTTFHMLMRT